MQQNSLTPKIFGIGLNKTGTTTLGHALHMLGILTIDYPTDARTLEQLERGEYRLDLLNQYQAVTDMPVGFFYPQLDALYPGSKFILTVREKKAWLRSVREHWPFVAEWARYDEPFRRFTYYAFVCVYGAYDYDEARYSYVYDKYKEDALRYFHGRPDDLLVLDICAGEGWEKLCPFLGVPVPDQPFPHLNSREEKRVRRQWIVHLEEAIDELRSVLPGNAPVIMVDEGKLAGSPVYGPQTLSFLERNGVYDGLPADSAHALRELNRMRAEGADYIAFAWPSFWWLDHYTDFAAHLCEAYPRLFESERWIVFALKSGAGKRGS